MIFSSSFVKISPFLCEGCFSCAFLRFEDVFLQIWCCLVQSWGPHASSDTSKFSPQGKRQPRPLTRPGWYFGIPVDRGSHSLHACGYKLSLVASLRCTGVCSCVFLFYFLHEAGILSLPCFSVVVWPKVIRVL